MITFQKYPSPVFSLLLNANVYIKVGNINSPAEFKHSSKHPLNVIDGNLVTME